MVVRVGGTPVVIEDCHSIPDRHMHVKKHDPSLPGKGEGMKCLVWGKRDLDTRQLQQA